jgi:nucleoid DNA-binding protein
MKDQISKEIVSIITEELMRRGNVRLESLGTFKVEHQKQRLRETLHGSITMLPPQDVLEFEPES